MKRFIRNKILGEIMIIMAVMAVVLIAREMNIRNNIIGIAMHNDKTINNETRQRYEKTLIFEEQEYTYKNKLINILVIGIDGQGELKDKVIPGEGEKTEFLFLLSLDKEKQNYKMIPIPGTLITEIYHYDKTGMIEEKLEGQLCQQYAWNIGGQQSCIAVKRMISRMFPDILIDGYLTINEEGIRKMAEIVGEDYLSFKKIKIGKSEEESIVCEAEYLLKMLYSFQDSNIEELVRVLATMWNKTILTNMSEKEIKDFGAFDVEGQNVVLLPIKTLKGKACIMNEEMIMPFVLEHFYESERQ